jgi:hypothetical protein
MHVERRRFDSVRAASRTGTVRLVQGRSVLIGDKEWAHHSSRA